MDDQSTNTDHTTNSYLKKKKFKYGFDLYICVIPHSGFQTHNMYNCICFSVWISPMFPKIASSGASSSGDSATNFKRDLIQYLNAYKARQVNEWVEIIRGHDMSQAKQVKLGLFYFTA